MTNDKVSLYILTQTFYNEIICHEIILIGNVVKRVTSTKFLVLIVDDQLKWKQHIDYIKNTVSKSIVMLTDIH